MKIEIRFDVNDQVYFLHDHKITVGYVESVNFSKHISLLDRTDIKENISYAIRYKKDDEDKYFSSYVSGISEKSCFTSREELIMSIQ